MSAAEKSRHVSGWYSKGKLSAEEEAARRQQVEDWLAQRIALNYRQVAVEMPGRMVLALGRLAQAQGVTFEAMVEGVLADYLARQGIDWRVQS